MKNKIILGLIILFSVTLSAQNYTNFESDVRFYDNTETVSISHYGEYEIAKNFGVLDYIAVNNESYVDDYNGTETYGEALLGLYVNPCPNVTIGALAGISTYSKELRLGALAYYENDRLLVSAFYERDQCLIKGDNEWHDLQIRYAVCDADKHSLYLGTRYKSGYGLGVPVGMSTTVGNSNVYLFYTTYYNVDNTDAVGSEKWLPTVGLNIEF